VSDQSHGTCGACGSGITVEAGLVVGRDDADLLAALERLHPKSVHAGFGRVGRTASGAYIYGPIDYGEGCETCAAIARVVGAEVSPE
jgi:hypothetical protein